MTDSWRFLDGRRLLTRSPFSSLAFVSMTVMALVTTSLFIFLIERHWRVMPNGTLGILIGFVGIQFIYQWVRGLLYYRKMRKLVRASAEAEETLSVATEGITHALLCYYGSSIILLIVVIRLLSR